MVITIQDGRTPAAPRWPEGVVSPKFGWGAARLPTCLGYCARRQERWMSVDLVLMTGASDGIGLGIARADE